MSKDTQMIHDVATGEITIVELSDAEIKARQKEADAIAAARAAKEAEELAKAEAKAALFEKLGITADEAKLLLG